MSKQDFLKNYVLNAAVGAGMRKLNVEAAVREAVSAWYAIIKEGE